MDLGQWSLVTDRRATQTRFTPERRSIDGKEFRVAGHPSWRLFKLLLSLQGQFRCDLDLGCQTRWHSQYNLTS